MKNAIKMLLAGLVGFGLALAMTHAGCDGDGGTDAPAGDSGTTKDSPGTDTTADTTTDQPSGTLKWYKTCGDPACGGHRPDPNVSECTTETEGDACTTKDAKCDPKNNCNAHLICTDTDPKAGSCPISQRAAKFQLRYLQSQDKKALQKALMTLRLATYRYRRDGAKGPQKMGFIIDDKPHKALLYGKGQRVDLYSYLSMVTATLQLQAAQIRALQKQLRAQPSKTSQVPACQPK